MNKKANPFAEIGQNLSEMTQAFGDAAGRKLEEFKGAVGDAAGKAVSDPLGRTLLLAGAGAVPAAAVGGISQASWGIRPGETEAQYRQRVLRASLLGALAGGAAVPLADAGIRNILTANPIDNPDQLRGHGNPADPKYVATEKALADDESRRHLIGMGGGLAAGVGVNAMRGAQLESRFTPLRAEALSRATKAVNEANANLTAAMALTTPNPAHVAELQKAVAEAQRQQATIESMFPAKASFRGAVRSSQPLQELAKALASKLGGRRSTLARGTGLVPLGVAAGATWLGGEVGKGTIPQDLRDLAGYIESR